MAIFATRKGSLHSRGNERRALLLASARTLLAKNDLDRLSLGDVAKHAGVPVSSAYHFYSDVRDLSAALLTIVEAELLEEYKKPLRRSVRSWQEVIAILVKKGVGLYAADPAARQLMIGPKIPPELKLRDRGNDVALGQLYEGHVDAQFRLPRIANRSRIFFRAVEIIDLMFCLSMVEAGGITEEYEQEAVHAAVGYLGFHIPARLPRRETS